MERGPPRRYLPRGVLLWRGLHHHIMCAQPLAAQTCPRERERAVMHLILASVETKLPACSVVCDSMANARSVAQRRSEQHRLRKCERVRKPMAYGLRRSLQVRDSDSSLSDFAATYLLTKTHVLLYRTWRPRHCRCTSSILYRPLVTTTQSTRDTFAMANHQGSLLHRH